MPSYTIRAGEISQPIVVGAGSIVTVTPASGATASLTYTKGNLSDIKNNTATFTAWPKGTVTSVARDMFLDNAYIIVTSTSGATVVDVNANPSTNDTDSFRMDLASLNAAFNPSGSALTSPITGTDILFGTRHKSAILRRPNSFISNGNGNANNITESIKFEVPFAFTWVRLWLMAKSGATPPAGTAYKAIVAVTETMANDTDVNRYTPIINGTSQNVMAATNVPGWNTVTFDNGAATTGAVPQLVYTNNHYDSYKCSDRIMLNSIPRTDGGSGFLCMLRLNLPNDAGLYNQISTGITLNNTTFPNNKIQRNLRNGADGVTVLANYPTGSASNDAMGNYFLEFGTQADVGTAVAFGDSISTYSLTLNAAGMDTWIASAFYDSMPGVGHISNACGSTNAAEWKAEWDYFFAQEINNSTKYVLLPVMTPNFGFDLVTINQTLTVVDYILDQCATKGIKVFLWTPYFFPAATPANQLVAINWAKAAAAAGRCVLVDINAAIPSGTAHLLGDNIHPNNIGTNIMKGVLAPVLAANR